MRKKIWILTGVFVLIAAGFWLWRLGYFASKPSAGVLANVDMRLTPDQQKIYTDKIAKSNEYLKTLKPSSPVFEADASNTYVFLCQQYFGLGQMQKSREMCELALKYNPKNIDAMVQLSAVFSKAGENQQAKAWLNQALKINPKDYNVWLEYIQLNQSLGAANEEITGLYGQAILNTDGYVDVLTSDARFQEQIGQYQQAISLWQQAKEKNPQNSAAYDQEISRLQNLAK